VPEQAFEKKEESATKWGGDYSSTRRVEQSNLVDTSMQCFLAARSAKVSYFCFYERELARPQNGTGPLGKVVADN
jgi:hypothetical protein